MGQAVVHVEVSGKDPEKLRGYYGHLFGWKFDTGGPVSSEISEPKNYGFSDGNKTSDGIGIPGGIGGGAGYEPYVTFYVNVPDVEAALSKAEELGGKRTMGPDKVKETGLVIGHFTDPEGNLVGVAQFP